MGVKHGLVQTNIHANARYKVVDPAEMRIVHGISPSQGTNRLRLRFELLKNLKNGFLFDSFWLFLGFGVEVIQVGIVIVIFWIQKVLRVKERQRESWLPED
jgi:hypothetical protein